MVLSKQLTPIIISYPNDCPLDYDGLEHYLDEQIKAKEPFVILAESLLVIRHLQMGKDAPDDMVNTFREIVKAVNPKVLATRIRSVFIVNAKQALANCPHPILYLCATKDRIVSRRGLEQIRKIRHDVEVAFIDAPHLLLQCMPEQAAEVIQSFLKRRNLCL